MRKPIIALLLCLPFGGTVMAQPLHCRAVYYLKNPTAAAVPDATVTLRVPGGAAMGQTSTLMRIEPEPVAIHTDACDNVTIEWQFDEVFPFQRTRLSYEAEVALPEENRFAGDALPDEADPVSEHPRIPSIAGSLTGERPVEIVTSAMQWIDRHIKIFTYEPQLRGVDWCLEHGRGDCTERALLLAELCRAREIPARMVSGYLVDTRLPIINEATYHAWILFHDGRRWVVADPTLGGLGEDAAPRIGTSVAMPGCARDDSIYFRVTTRPDTLEIISREGL